MKLLVVLLFVCCVHLTLSAHTWKWHDCSVAKTRVLTMTKFDISPKPLHIPGNATVTLIGDIAHQLAADAHYSLNVKMDKKLLGHWHPVPCSQKVGTCLYDDPCEFLQQFAHNHTCPKAFTDHGLSCTCPFNPVTLNVTPSVIPIKSIPAQWQFLATGDFKARVEVLHQKVMIGCFEAELSIETPCTGFFCHGRK